MPPAVASHCNRQPHESVPTSRLWLRASIALVALIVGSFCLATPAGAVGGLTHCVGPIPTTVHCDDHESSISAGLFASVDGDTVLVGPGRYHENVVINKSVTLNSLDGAASTTINGGHLDTVVFIAQPVVGSTGKSAVAGFTIENGNSGGGTSCTDGGGISARGGNLRIVNNIIRDNAGCDGGGIALSYPDNAVVAGNTIENNSVWSPYGHGGGIVMAGQAQLVGNRIIGNKAPSSAGVVIDGITKGTTIENNRITGNGPSTIAAGISIFDSEVSLVQNIVDYNLGVGIYVGGNPPGFSKVLSNTVVNNRGTGVILDVFGSPASPGVVANNIVVTPISNLALQCTNGNVTPTLVDNDLFSKGLTGLSLSCASALDNQGNFGADPRFVSRPHTSYRLSAKSPCLAAGSDSAPGFPTLGTPARDFRGRLRYDEHSRAASKLFDLGVFER